MNHLVEEIFTQAMELDPGDRQHFVDEACAGNRELRHLVEQLLVDAEGADAYFTKALGEAPWVGASGNRLIEKEGDWVGHYKLLQQIGEGGFGVVWMAEQSKPISRRVAVKVIKAGMDTKEVLARFDAERQALARMDHRNIARVIDAGATLTGRPYFAMDLVKGMPITRYCDEQQLDAHERLLLFADVCAAINHAHQKGVIHRDIKPSNVLVTLDGDKPMVKVIDFGISKAIEGKLTDGTLFTRLEQWVGTPVYMSPEQAGLGSLDIDTRSDIYALGVLLYELLTGVPPFDQATLIKAGYEEMRRIIREVEPIRPSQRLTYLHAEQGTPNAAARRLSGDRLHRLIAGDLDWIVMKAIDKSRDRRYDTAAALAEDIARFLADEPVTAKPPSARYVIGKFAKRHRLGIRVVLGAAVLLVAAAVVSSLLAIRAFRAEDLSWERLAETVRERNAKAKALEGAETVARFLTEVFKSPDPAMDGKSVTVASALDNASAKLKVDLKDQPERRAMLLAVLAGTYEGLALYERAAATWQEVMELQRSLKGTGDPEFRRALRRLGKCRELLGDYAGARLLGDEEVRLLTRLYGPTHEETLLAMGSLADNLFCIGEHDQAIAMQRDVLDRLRSLHGKDAEITLQATRTLIRSLIGVGRKAEIAAVSEEIPKLNLNFGEYYIQLGKALEQETQKLGQMGNSSGATDPQRMLTLERLASLHSQVGDPQAAVSYQEQAVELRKQRCGFDHPETIAAQEFLANLLLMSADGHQASLLNEELRVRKSALAKQKNPGALQNQLTLLGYPNPNKCRVLADDLLPRMKKEAGPEGPGYLRLVATLADWYCFLGRTREAMELMAQVVPKSAGAYETQKFAGLQLWFGQNKNYCEIRRVRFDHLRRWVPVPTNIHHVQEVHQRNLMNLLLCCFMPMDDSDQQQELLVGLARAEASRASQTERKEITECAVITGIIHFRTGDYQKALASFAEAERINSERNERLPAWQRTIPRWEQTLERFFKAMAMYHTGHEKDGFALFQSTAKSMKRWPSNDHPMLGTYNPRADELTYCLAYKEAAKLFGAAGMVEQIANASNSPSQGLSFASNKLTAEGTTFLAGDTIKLTATVKNSGKVAMQNVSVSFYDGYPASGGTLIQTATVQRWLQASDEVAVPIRWTIPSPDIAPFRPVYAVVHPAGMIPQSDETDNMGCLTLNCVNLRVSYVSGVIKPDGSVRVVARVKNFSAPASPVTILRLKSEDDARTLAQTDVSSLSPGNSVEISLDLPAGTQPEGERTYSLTVDEDGLTGDVDTSNNKVQFSLNLFISTANDGIPDWWKRQYGFSITDPTVANADPDNDGFTNLQEYLAGTNPLDASSFLKVGDFARPAAVESEGLAISWAPVAGRSYNLERSCDLIHWTQVRGNVLATPPLNTVVDTEVPPAGKTFFLYRLTTPK